MDVIKRAALAKGPKHCKLIMLVDRATLVHLELYRRGYLGLAYYMFMWHYESYTHCGESGAHRNVVEIEFSKESVDVTPSTRFWAVSVTLNVSLDGYKKMREEFVFTSRSPGLKKAKPVPMPGFEEIKG